MKTEAAPTTGAPGSDPLSDRPAASATASRSAGLLSLVRGLIAFGEALIRTLQSSPAAGMLSEIAGRFGTTDLALIIARINRGLMLAANLDARLVRSASRLDTPPARPATVRAAGSPRRRGRASLPTITQQADEAALLAALPTAQEIAARVRGKSIGVVLEQICLDLGISRDHPLWDALQDTIVYNGGSLVRVFNATWQRMKAGGGALAEFLTAAIPHPHPVAAALAPAGAGPS